MTVDTRETIMDAARAIVQAHGYNGLSFRDLAAEVGIKSASVHYHFPTKGDLGAAIARRYTETARVDLDDLLARTSDSSACLARYTAIFRRALEDDNCMCLCGILAAEYDDLPPAVKAEVRAFADVNVAWLTKVLALAPEGIVQPGQRALAIFAAIGGAQLAARSRNDIAIYDAIIESYRTSGLVPR
ncbi:TetR/AcrR family transcriptional regulator [Sphingomonas sp. MMS24-J13]|uniref:TetR/AcrR family transcriptional regulator n=1 Tax=Sphingomonas sp. MMS24-J13 TaxID=3238686 RepID=UPI00384E0362